MCVDSGVSVFNIKNWPIAWKLIAAFVTILGLGFIGFFVEYRASSATEWALKTQITSAMDAQRQTGEASAASGRMAAYTYLYSYSGNPEHLKLKEQSDEDLGAAFEQTQTAIKKLENNSTLLALLDTCVEADEHGCHPLETKISELLSAGKQTEAHQILVRDYLPAQQKLTDSYAKLAHAVDEYADSKKDSLLASSHKASQAGLILQIIVLLLGIGVGIVVAKYISNQTIRLRTALVSLEEHCFSPLQSGLEAMSKGDLTYRVNANANPIPATSTDEFGKLATDYNRMVNKVQSSVSAFAAAQSALSSLAGRVASIAGNVKSEGSELSHSTGESGRSSQDIAQGTERLAMIATQTSSLMENLYAEIERVAKGADDQTAAMHDVHRSLDESVKTTERVGSEVRTMSESAHQGSSIVEQTINSMQAIQQQAKRSADSILMLDEKGKQIGHIVHTIEDIAEQTNLLALNAAIEAARAGEHGRGFAVVAEEVRKLAEQASNATKEIDSLIAEVRSSVTDAVSAIEGTTKEVEAGAEATASTGKAFAVIVEQVEVLEEGLAELLKTTHRVSSLVSNVDTLANQAVNASASMAETAEQVRQSITEVAAVSEEGAAGAEELSATASEVAQTATRLQDRASELEQEVQKFRFEQNGSPNLKLAA